MLLGPLRHNVALHHLYTFSNLAMRSAFFPFVDGPWFDSSSLSSATFIDSMVLTTLSIIVLVAPPIKRLLCKDHCK